MAGADREAKADQPAQTPDPAPASAPDWTGLMRVDGPLAPQSPADRAALARLQRSAGNASVARLLGELAPPRLVVARQGDGAPAGTAAARAPGGALLVADEADEPGAGRMKVGGFLDAVEEAVAEVAAKELGPVFQVAGCPWLAH